MSRTVEPLESLVLDLLEWVGPRGRPYREVMEAWTTSCPRLPVWEEALDRALVVRAAGPPGVPTVEVTALGAERLVAARRCPVGQDLSVGIAATGSA